MHIIHHEYPICMVVALLIIAAFVSIVTKWLKIPYSIALVLIGLLIGQFNLLPELKMNPHLVLLVFLPPLLFDAALNLKFKELSSLWKPIILLATLGVCITIAITATGLHFLAGLPPLSAVLLSCIVAPTDPISVVAVFRKLGIDGKTISLIEGESLFNDGTSVVLFRLVTACILAGSSLVVSIKSIPIDFITLSVGAIIVGGTIGFLSAKLAAVFDDRSLMILLTTIVAYGTYILAEFLNTSEIIAVVVSALVFARNTMNSSVVSSTTLHTLKGYWGYLSFVINSFIFIMIGAHIALIDIANHAVQIGVTILGLAIARAFLSYAILPASTSKLAKHVKHLVYWGALRGSLSMAMVMSLPSDFPDRSLFEIVTFGVVLFTLIVQGLSLEPLSRKLAGSTDIDSKIKTLKNILLIENSVANRLYSQFAKGEIDRATFQFADCNLKTRQVQLHEELTDLAPFSQSLDDKSFKALLVELNDFRIDSLKSLYTSQEISQDEFEQASQYLKES